MGISGTVFWCWEFLSSLQVPLPPSLSCSAFHHTGCLDVEASALFLVPSTFHVKTGKYLMGFWHSGFTGSANLFQEVLRFKTCMFLLSLLLPASDSSFLGCMVHEYTSVFTAPKEKKQCCQAYFSCSLSESIESFLLPFRKLFLGSAVSNFLQPLLQSRSFTKC